MAERPLNLPGYSFYAVLIPFVVNKQDKDHREIVSIADGLQARLKSNKKRNVYKCVLELGNASRDRDVSKLQFGPDDVLYVTAHGNLEVIGPMTGIDLTPKLLADALDGKVSKTLGHLKIMTCRSGGNAFNVDAYYVSSLCRFLHAKGFTELTVYGYTGNTGELEGKKPKHSYVVPGPHAKNVKDQERRYHARECRVAVKGSEGKVVETPKNRWDFDDAVKRKYDPDTGASL